MSSVRRFTWRAAWLAFISLVAGCASLLGADFDRSDAVKADAASPDAERNTETSPALPDASTDADRAIRVGAGRWRVEGTPGMLTSESKIWGAAPDELLLVNTTDGAWRSAGDGVWSPVLLLDPGFPFRAIWGTGKDDVYVVGDGQDIGYCGKTSFGWTLQSAPSGASWRAIWGSGPNDVYIGGDYGAVGHSYGNGVWQAQTTGAKSAISAIWGSGPNDVYAISLYDVFHSTGAGTWAQSFHAPARIHGLWGSGDNDVYVVGADGAVFHRGDGGEWTTTTVGTTSFEVVWGTGPNDVYLGGADGTILHRGADGAWERDDVEITDDIVAIWGTSSSNVYALTMGVSGHGSVLHRTLR